MLKAWKKQFLKYNILNLYLVLNLLLVACSEKPKPLPNDLPPAPPDTVRSDWAMAGYSTYLTGQNPDFTALNADNIGQTALRWQYEANVPLTLTPAVVGELIYLNNGQGKLAAINRQDGRELWKYDYKGSSQSSPVVAGGVVYFATVSGQLLALKATDGALLWQREFGQPTLASPIYQDKILYLNFLPLDPAQPLSNTLAALNVSDGSTLWQSDILPSAQLSRAKAIMTATPPVINQSFYLLNGAGAASIGAIRIGRDSKSGQESNGALNAALLYHQGKGYAVMSGGDVAAFSPDKALATPLWYQTGADDISKETPVPPALADKALIVVDNKFDGRGRVRSLSLEDGKVNWEWLAPNQILAPPSVGGNGLVYIGTTSGTLQILNAKDGKPLWNYQVKGAIRARPILAGDSLYLAAQDGALYRFGTGNPSQSPAAVPEPTLTYQAEDSNGYSQLFALKSGSNSLQLTMGDFAIPPKPEQLPGTYLDPPSRLNYNPAISPDGSKVAFVSRSSAAIKAKTNLFITDIRGNSAPHPLDDANSHPLYLTWAKASHTLYWIGEKSNLLYRLKLDGNNRAERVGLTGFANWRPHYLQVSPDERYLYFTAFDIDRGEYPERKAALLIQLDLTTGQYELLTQERLPFTTLTLSPDGKWLAYVREINNQNGGDIMVLPTKSGLPRQVGEGRAPVAFAPYLVSSGYLSGYNLVFPPKGANITAYNAVALDPNMQIQGKATVTAALATLKSADFSWAQPAQPPTFELSKLAVYQPTAPYQPDKVEAEQARAGKYAFTADGKLFLSTGDGAAVAELPTPPGRSSQPVLAPDGQKLAFVLQPANSDETELWVMQTDGQNPRRILGKGRNLSPTWSPDSIKLAFSSNRAGANYQLWSVDVNSPDPEATARQLTNEPASCLQPTWGNQGQLIIYVLANDDAPAAPIKYVGNELKVFVVASRQSQPIARFVTKDNKVLIERGLDGRFGSQVVLNNADQANGVTLGMLNPTYAPDAKFIAFNVLTYLPGKDGTPQSEIRTAFLESTPTTFQLVQGWGECNGYKPTWTGSDQQAISCISTKLDPALLSRLLYEPDPALPGDLLRGSSKIAKPGAQLAQVQTAHRYPITGISWSL